MGEALTKALEVEGLTKVFDNGLTAVDNITFFIESGVIHGISGSKSYLISWV